MLHPILIINQFTNNTLINTFLFSKQMDQLIFIILLCGAIQGAFLSAVYMLKKHGNKTSNRILSVLLFLFSLSIALHALGHRGYIDFLPDHEPVVTVLVSLYNPLIYLYIITQTGKNKYLTFAQSFHFIPAIIIALYLTYTYNIIIKAAGINNSNPVSILQEIIHSFIVLQYLVYTFFSIKEIITYGRLMKISSSSYNKNTLKWIGLLLGFNSLTWLVAIIVIVYSEISSEFIKNWDFVWLFASFYIYLIGYFSLNQEPAVTVDRRLISDKYKSSNLTPEKAEQIFQKLEKAVKEEKIFLTEDLTITALANELDSSIHHLSQVINDRYKMNFSEYINRQRIEEAKRIIKNDNEINIADIAFNIGFNSLSSFNSAFKKFTSTTPTQYKNSL